MNPAYGGSMTVTESAGNFVSGVQFNNKIVSLGDIIISAGNSTAVPPKGSRAVVFGIEREKSAPASYIIVARCRDGAVYRFALDQIDFSSRACHLL
ncbi:MAG: hypothetical protein WCT32_01490 [Patescibacteria group bacterium]|jgi:hypothetical protein